MPDLNIAGLLDTYEIKARLAPAVISVLPAIPIFGVLGGDLLGLLEAGILGTAVGAIGSLGLAFLASLLGRRYEKSVWPDTPLGLPTHQRLRRSDSSIPTDRKAQYYEAIQRLTGINLANSDVARDDHDRLIVEAVVDLRSQFRNVENVKSLLESANAAFGFARNLAGLRLIWLPLACVSLLTTWSFFVFGDVAIVWPLVAVAVLLLCLIITIYIKEYVRDRAFRYSESFFSMLMAAVRAVSSQPNR